MSSSAEQSSVDQSSAKGGEVQYSEVEQLHFTLLVVMMQSSYGRLMILVQGLHAPGSAQVRMSVHVRVHVSAPALHPVALQRRLAPGEIVLDRFGTSEPDPVVRVRANCQLCELCVQNCT